MRFDLAKIGVLSSRDSLGFRIAQPLRVEHGGFAMMLPTSYDYATGDRDRHAEPPVAYARAGARSTPS